MNPDNKYFKYSPEQISKLIKMVGAACLGMLTLFLLVKTINEIKTYSTIGEFGANGVQNTISVNGTSDMDVQPDVTVFTWNVDADGKTVAEAQSKAADINNKAIAYVKEKGIKEADIKTLSLNTSPRYENSYKNCPVYNASGVSAVAPAAGTAVSSMVAPAGPTIVAPCNGNSVIVGYTTSISIQVKVRDIDRDTTKTSELVGGLAPLGVKVSNPVSTVDDMDGYKQKVRDEAISKAREQAEKLAGALGVKLVRVTSFYDNSGNPYPMAMDYAVSARAGAMEAKATVPDLPTGTNKITANVTITYQIR